MGKKVKIYCIPGLSLDHRLFNKLNILEAELHFIDWIKAEGKESIKSYAKRLAEKLPKDEKISLMGVSLGGIIAVEISQIREIEKLFLISTVKNKEEMPNYMSWLNNLPSNNNMAMRLGIDATIKLKPYYDNADSSGNKLFKEMMKAADVDFVNWGIHQVAQWKFKEKLKTPFLHIHGTNDLIFPIKHIDQAITIKGGSHFTVYNEAEKISKIISREIERDQLLKPSKS